jgi:hypothetical protein
MRWAPHEKHHGNNPSILLEFLNTVRLKLGQANFEAGSSPLLVNVAPVDRRPARIREMLG